TVAVANGVLYAVGGAIRPPEPGIAVATVEAYDPVTDTWTSKAAMPTPREAAAGGVVNDIIYVAGGLGVSTSSGSFLSTVEAYEPIANAWTTMAPMPAAQDDVTGTLTAGGSSLSYDPAADLYTYVWKTDKTWAGSCRELAVTLSDNTVHKASFKLTK